jgi:hypothetical protein
MLVKIVERKMSDTGTKALTFDGMSGSHVITPHAAKDLTKNAVPASCVQHQTIWWCDAGGSRAGSTKND